MRYILRVIALFLLGLVLFSIFAACDAKNNGGSDTGDESATETGKITENDTGTEKSTTAPNNKETDGDKPDENENGNTENTEAALKALAVNAYNALKQGGINADTAEFLIYKVDGKAVALHKGVAMGVFANSDRAVKALLGEGALELYELEESSVENLFCCVAVERYSYPLDILPEPTAAIDSYKDGKYVANGNRYASLIPLAGLDYDRVTIKNGSQNGVANLNFAYTFLAEEPVLDKMPVYAKGYSYVIVVEPVQTLTINIPEDAEYLYVYHHTRTGKYYFPDEVIFSRNTRPENSFTLATWNTGNFSGGGKNTTILDTQLEEKKALYTDFIENRINADLICLNEFDPNFTKSGNYATKDVLFDDYVDHVGEKYGYQCNSMFARPSLDMTVPQAYNFGNGYGYYATKVSVGGETVTVVSIHLNYDHNYQKGTTDEINRQQILDVIEIFAQRERVILLGDWNCIQFKQYELLTDAGYSLANTDPSLHTKTGSAIDNFSLDNIAYKGVTISNFTCEVTNLSDHFALRCTVSVD